MPTTAAFVCPQCQATFRRPAHLHRHQKTHRAEKPYRCSFCDVASSWKDVIVRHTRNFHSTEASEDITHHQPPLQASLSSSSPPFPPLSQPLDYRAGIELPSSHHVARFDDASNVPLDLGLFDFSVSALSAGVIHDSMSASQAALPTGLRTDTSFAYAQAHANLDLHRAYQVYTLEFPSQYAAQRLVNAFFKHLAPHMPIVYFPTFDMGAVAREL
jgi:hypothetical protein